MVAAEPSLYVYTLTIAIVAAHIYASRANKLCSRVPTRRGKEERERETRRGRERGASNPASRAVKSPARYKMNAVFVLYLIYVFYHIVYVSSINCDNL